MYLKSIQEKHTHTTMHPHTQTHKTKNLLFKLLVVTAPLYALPLPVLIFFLTSIHLAAQVKSRMQNEHWKGSVCKEEKLKFNNTVYPQAAFYEGEHCHEHGSTGGYKERMPGTPNCHIPRGRSCNFVSKRAARPPS